MSVNRKTNSGLQKLAGLYNALTARLSDLLDVQISSPTNGQAMLYNSTTQKWENGNVSSSSTFTLTITYDDELDEYTCNKLPSEVATAYSNGDMIQATDSQSDFVYNLTSYDVSEIMLVTSECWQENGVLSTGAMYSFHLVKDSESNEWSTIEHFSTPVTPIFRPLVYKVGDNVYSCNQSPELFSSAISNYCDIQLRYVEDDSSPNDVVFFRYVKKEDTSYYFEATHDSTSQTFILTEDEYGLDWDSITLTESMGGDPNAIKWSEAKTSVKKNWLPNNAISQTVNGITFTVNADKSVTINGTATADAMFNLCPTQGFETDIGRGDNKSTLYLASGSYLFTNATSTSITSGVRLILNNVNGVAQWVDADNTTVRTITAPEHPITVGINVASGTVVSNLTLYPMIRLASVQDSTYVPYIPDNTELVDWKSNGILGAKNLIDAPSTLSYSASAEASRSFGTLYLTVGDSIIVTANQMGAVTSVDRNTITITRPNSAGTIYENTSANYHIGSGLHKLKYVATETGIHDFKVWVKNPNTSVNFNQFMVRYSSDSDDTYQPYTKTNRQLTEDVYADMDWASNNVLGAKNLIPNLFTSQVINGLTITVNDDGTITINGTCTTQTSLGIIPSTQGMQYLAPLFKLGKLTISNTGIGGSRGQFNLFLHDTVAGNKNFGAWGVDVTYDFSPYANTVDSTNFSLIILKDAVFNNEIVTPMIRLAADTDGTYTPYAKTNQQLTTDSVDWDNGKISVKKNYLSLKHLRPNQTYTHSGITYTYNGDGTITANGTATSDSYWYFITGLWIYIPNGQYVLNGSIGGSNNTYQLRLNYYNTSGTIVEAPTSRDGDSGILTLNSSRTGDLLKINSYIFVYSGQVLDNVVFKPMLRALSVIDNSFVEYVPSNNELLSYNDNTMLGAKNWLPCDLSYMRIVNTTGTSWSNNVYTINGVTFTINADGTITANGTATGGRADIYLRYNNTKSGLLANTLYTLTGCPSGGSSTKYCMQFWNNSAQTGDNDFGNGCNFYLPSASNQVTILARVCENQTASNLTFKPMIRLATDVDATYTPYTPSNRDLFAKIAPIKIEVQTYTADSISQIVKHILDNIVDAGNYQQRGFLGGFTWTGHDHYTMEGYLGDRYARGIVSVKDIIYPFNYDANTKTININTINPSSYLKDIHLDQTATTSTTTDTVYTFTDARITSSSAIDVYADIFGVAPSNVVTTNGSCTVTFPKQATAQSMTCRIYIK